LAQLIGHSDSASAVTAAFAGLAIEVCGPSVAKCERCPLSDLCRSAGTPAVAGAAQ
jgi:adenine-specific DNA glycosylase